MWACALGHTDAAVVLYKWDRRAISIPDSLGRLPLTIARSRGHVKLAECLEQLQREEQSQLRPSPRLPCPSQEEPSGENWTAQWPSKIIASQDQQKGITAISNSNTGRWAKASFCPSSQTSTLALRMLPSLVMQRLQKKSTKGQGAPRTKGASKEHQ